MPSSYALPYQQTNPLNIQAMASSKCMVAFLLILAAVAASLHPSSAARVLAGEDSSAPAPPAFWRPRVPLPSFPCIPGLPWPRFLPPCNDSVPLPPLPPLPPSPAECHTSLSGLMPCADFLTANATSLSPPAAACCDGVKSLVQDAPVCLCHVMNGDFGRLLLAPARLMRAVALPRVCGVRVPFGTLGMCFREPVPPMDVPPPS